MEKNKKEIIITQKLKLKTNNIKEFKITSSIFNDEVTRVFEMLLNNEELLNQSNRKIIQDIQKMNKDNAYNSQLSRVFERAVASIAIGNAKTFIKVNQDKDYKNITIKKLNVPIRFYKRTYKFSEDGQVSFRLFNGDKWEWCTADIYDWEKIKNEEKLSPSIIINKNQVEMVIPIKKQIKSFDNTKYELMKEKDLKVCGVAFTNTNTFAVCVALDNKGNLIDTKFIKGGNRYQATVKRILGKISKYKNNKNIITDDNLRKWQKLSQVNKYYAHYVSKQIISFCQQNEAKVISLTRISNDKIRANLKLNYMRNISTPLELSKKIRKYLEYKAEITSIPIIESNLNPYNKCYKCLTPINRDSFNIQCQQGHKGNYYFNAAMNIGRTCLRKLGKKI